MKILGIDPGTRVVGYAVIGEDNGRLRVHACGAIRTRSEDEVPVRLKAIYIKLSEVISEYAPEEVAIEKVFFGKNFQSAIRIGEGRGVAFLAAANAGLPVYEYDPTKIKKAVTGVGTAHKSQIQAMVQAILELSSTPTPADVADALAIAICHYQNRPKN